MNNDWQKEFIDALALKLAIEDTSSLDYFLGLIGINEIPKKH